MGNRSTAAVIEVQPLPHLPSVRLGEGSSSVTRQDDIAYASDLIFDKLVQLSGDETESSRGIYVALQWPQERRLAVKGKSTSLVIQVRRPPSDLVSV